MKQRIAAVLVVVAVVAMGYGAWRYATRTNDSGTETLGGSGTIEAAEIVVSPQTTGRILSAPGTEGVAVKTGEVLYRLDSSIASLQVSQAQAGVRAAQAALDQARDDGTDAEQDAAKAQLDQAKVALSMAKVQYGWTVVRSPIDGTLTDIVADAGENAVPGSTLAVISDLAHLTVSIYVPESRIGQVAIGDTARLTTDSSTRTFRCRVAFIASEAEFTPASIETKDQRVKLVYEVKLELLDAGSVLKPGMPADVTFE